MSTPPELPLGIQGIEALFDECRARPAERRGRELPVIVLLGRRGSGKTVTLRRLGYRAARRPHAFYDFASARPRRPHEVAARLAIGLSHRFPRQPALRFPRLALGLLVVRTGVVLDTAQPRASRAALRDALRRAMAGRDGEDALGRAGAVVAALQDLNVLAFPGLSLLVGLVQHGLPRLPAEVMWRTGLDWYVGGNGYRRLDALVALKERAQSEAPDDALAVDRTLCAAFLEDLIADAARHRRDRRFVALLDNMDTHDGRGFLDVLVAVREENAARRDVRDPLLIVTTASDARRVPGPFAPGPTGLSTAAPDRASYADWHGRAPRPAPDTSWRWYPVELRDLTANEVAQLGAGLPGRDEVTPLVHRLSYGHPWSVRQLQAAAGRLPGPAAVLDAPGPDGAEPLARRALPYLLSDLTADQRDALIGCAAPRAFDTAVDSGLLERFTAHTQDTLLQEIGARLWLTAPEPEDAGTHGGRGSGYLLPTRHPHPLPERAVLHPWLRLLLLQRLAERPADWTAVHAALREWHLGRERPVDAYYHSLALEDLEPVVARLHASLSVLPDTAAWLYELYAITAAPLRRPVDPETAPARRAPLLAERLAPRAYREHRALAILVTSLWLAGDPRNRLPGGGHELIHTIGAMFRELGVHSDARAAGLIHEAAKYEAQA
ncbi:hypothetical protein RM780_15815 [Streptomyces sp. DSM 44917]|uniref:Orc1-like AAA ATPase domain-containing protein n=1 Tax=Streptomyces boetiae TaxID=3075541 RepID=A0ABU2LA18_9ACTN|nr:hypothetical protein [Streptomyces sp. DSM 44917]MDT0308416.1 hypothetical protein [Streptomyces sp. DSM 44917]